MSIEISEARKYTSVTALLAANPRPGRYWELWDEGRVLALGRGNARDGLRGVELALGLIGEDATHGIVVLAPSGFTRESDGAVTLTSSGATTDVAGLDLALFGTQYLFSRLTLRLTASSSSQATGSSNKGDWTQVRIRQTTQGGGGQYVEIVYAFNGSGWIPLVHVFDGTTSTWTTGATSLAIGSLASMGFLLEPDQGGSITSPSFYASVASSYGSPQVASVGTWANGSGFDYDTHPGRGGSLQLFVSRGKDASGAPAGDISVTIASLTLTMWPGTGFA